MLQLLFNIGFIEIKIWDVLDILIVGFMMHQIYKLLKGSIAFNIFIGVVLLYVLWWLVGALHMDMLSMILGQFASVGVIIIVVIFQQEIRRFLLYLGNSTLKGRFEFLNAFLGREVEERRESQAEIDALYQTMITLSGKQTGALVILANHFNLFQFSEKAIILDATITKPLLESIFNKESPLHDGAVIIANYKIHAASCILPISERNDLPQWAGLRHRAALGISEAADVAAFVVSEENGKISVAYRGQLLHALDEKALLEQIEKHFD